ncbi:ATP-binding protein [Streptomyces sp. NPDC052013]|uniref:ATP-binding protein n=1 Tax=Streptomyces sp. NPDC052013 TaxID=3365679 RepID=UPI0037CDD6E9
MKCFIDSILRDNQKAPKKQKHPIDRILERLAREHDFEQASYSTVRDYVRKRRPQLDLESKEGRWHLEGMVPQEKRPAKEAEVDFADKKGARLLFQIFTEREERKATPVATNSSFAEWDKIFSDPWPCAAIADRITFRCALVQTGTKSYRFQTTEQQRKSQT